MDKKILMIAIVLVTVVASDAQTTYYRDSSGRLTGSVTTDGNGKTVYKDGQGRIQRTVTTDRNGRTTFRDSLGRTQGTVQTDARGKTTWRDASERVAKIHALEFLFCLREASVGFTRLTAFALPVNWAKQKG